MSKYCKYCGAELIPNARFCTTCGKSIEQVDEPKIEQKIERKVEQNTERKPVVRKEPMVSKRGIPLAIILSIVTCGIYTIYWQIKLTDEMNTLLNKPNETSGLMAFIYTIITCGIYFLYWLYKMGDNVDALKGKSGDTGILYLVLGLLCLGIIPMALAQDAINDKADGLY